MEQKPHELAALIRRAMAAQSEMGMGEMVLRQPPAENPRATADVIANGTKIISARQAIMTQSERSDEQMTQDSLDIGFESEYASLDEQRAAICECMACPLGKTRTNFVFGVGSPSADIMFVGEAPGQKEDELGEPFVGRAGQLLDKILAAMKLSRQEVYIANILKCRPPGNRDPQPDEMDKCFPYLREQVRLIRPKILCALGRIAAQAMLKTTTPLGKLRGQWHTYENVPLIVTYHPAALLRFQQYKRGTWEDMQLLLAKYEKMK